MIRKRTPFVILIVTALLSVFLKHDFLRFLLGFELVLFLAGIVEVLYLCKHVHGELLIPNSTVRKKESFLVQVNVKNESRYPIPELFVRAAVRTFPEREEVLLTGKIMLDSRESGAVTFAMDSVYCGSLEVRLERIVVQDHLGLFQRRIALESVAPKLVFLFPESSQDVDAPLENEIVPEGSDGSEERKGRQGEEFLGIREYQDGDLLKMVHWKLSARMSDLMVRELGEAGEALYWIYLDLEDAARDVGKKGIYSRDRELWDHFFETVDSVTTELLQAGHPFRILWIDYDRGTVPQFYVEDGASRREMMCALLHTDSYLPKDGAQITKELPIYEMESELIEIHLSGDLTRRTVQR